MIKLGMIGYGNRGSGLARLMTRLPFDARLVAVADIDPAAVRQRMARAEAAAAASAGSASATSAAAAPAALDSATVRIYDDPTKMLDAEQLDAVVVATRCSLHTTMALQVLARKLPLYLEKPVATSFEDYRRLAAAARAAEAAKVPTMVSFPLRVTQVAQTARRIIRSGQLGEISHVQATNNVPYGEVYFQTWYRDEHETGGLFLQKATHDVDAINCLLGEPEPLRVAAMTNKHVFRGDKPAGSKCVNCDEKLTCLESRFNPTASTGAGLQARPEDYLCAFAVDTGNEDSGNAIIEYAGGAQANYTQNFYSRRGAGTRKIRAIGHLGSIEFDWVTEQATVWMHHNSRVEQFDCASKGEGHGGGDAALAINFLQCVQGRAESVCPLSAGLRSALICLLARESARTGSFQSAAEYAAAQ